MNERIKELAEQATTSIPYRICPLSYKEIDDPAGDRIRKEFDRDKFAELIVRECANVGSRSMYPDTDPDYVGRKIKQHFGVEE